MGKVARRLTIIALPPLGAWPEIVKLEEQGHTIISDILITDPVTMDHPALKVWFTKLSEADLIIGPQCWYFDTQHRKYLTLAIKQARLKRYGPPVKKANKKDGKAEDLEE